MSSAFTIISFHWFSVFSLSGQFQLYFFPPPIYVSIFHSQRFFTSLQFLTLKTLHQSYLALWKAALRLPF